MEFKMIDPLNLSATLSIVSINLVLVYYIFLYNHLSELIFKLDTDLKIGDEGYNGFKKMVKITSSVLIVILLIIAVISIMYGNMSLVLTIPTIVAVICVFYTLNLTNLLCSEQLLKFLKGRQAVSHDERNYSNTTIVSKYMIKSYCIFAYVATTTVVFCWYMTTTDLDLFFIGILGGLLTLGVILVVFVVINGFEIVLDDLYSLDIEEQEMLDKNISADLDKVKECTSETDVSKKE